MNYLPRLGYHTKLDALANARKLVISIGCLVAMSSSAFAATAVPLSIDEGEKYGLGVYELKIPGPGTQFNDPSCKSEATAIAENFAKASGAVIVEVDCQSGSANVHKAVIHYVATARVSIYDANRDIVPIVSLSYAKMEDCVQGLAAEVPVFRQHTGLDPFASWCYVAHRSDYGLRDTYLSAIYAVNPGSEIANAKHLTYATISNPPVAPAALANVAREMAERAGVDVVWSDASLGMGLWHAAVAYYSENEITLSADTLGHLPTIDACNAKAASLNAAWTASESTDTHFFCMDAHYGVPQLGLMWRSTPDQKDKEFTITRFNKDYLNQDACEAAGSEMVNRLTQNGQVVLASICVHEKYPEAGEPLPPLQLTIITR